MDMQKEREAFEAYMADHYKNTVDQRICINSDGDYMSWDMGLAWRIWQAAKAQAVPKNPWVYFDKPELNQDEDSDCLTSKEVFFEVSHLCGIYHGWYVARPVDKSDQYFYEEELENDDVEYEYFFNANVGDELFDEDSIARWMYVPEAQEQGHESE